MIQTTLEQITEQVLQKLCDDRCPESGSLDFKRVLPGSSDKDKLELLKDVSAFANADGGDLVFGIEEKSGGAWAIAPIVIESADAANRRISQVLDAGIEPRVQGIRLFASSVAGGYVLVVRIPASFDGPHSVRSNNLRRFVMRNGTATTDLTFDQIRVGFDRTATLAEKARRFVENRLNLVIDGKTSKPMIKGPVCVIHLVPISGQLGRHVLDLPALYAQGLINLQGRDWGGSSRSFNLDGLVLYPGGSPGDGYHAYTQVFRTGAIEASWLGGERHHDTTSGKERAVIWSEAMTEFFRASVGAFLGAEGAWGFSGPGVLRLALLHVEGFELATGDRYFSRFGPALSDRPHLVLPEVWLENLDNACVDDVVRPMMDMLWQAFDIERCPAFDAITGKYKREL